MPTRKKIDTNHLSYCDGQALTHFVYFNSRRHRHTLFQ